MTKNILRKITTFVLTVAMTGSMFAFSSKAATVINQNLTTKQNVTSYDIMPVTTGEIDQFSVKSYGFVSDGQDTVIPVTLKKGIMQYKIYSKYSGDFSLYQDQNCTIPLGGKIVLSEKTPVDASGFYAGLQQVQIPADGVYYLKAVGTQYKADYYFAAMAFLNSDRLLNEKEWTTSYTSSTAKNAIYYKVVIPKGSNGYLTLNTQFLTESGTGNNKGYANVTLCSKKKKAISSQIQMENDNNKYVYAVKGGTTYYIKVDGSQGVHRINYTLKKVNTKFGKSKEKAISIKKSKWVKGCIYSEDKKSQSQYYKIKVKKPATITVSAKAESSADGIKVSVSSDKLKGSANMILSGMGSSLSTRLKYTKSDGTYDYKVPAGVYYVKVSKAAKYSNAYYKIKVAVK